MTLTKSSQYHRFQWHVGICNRLFLVRYNIKVIRLCKIENEFCSNSFTKLQSAAKWHHCITWCCHVTCYFILYVVIHVHCDAGEQSKLTVKVVFVHINNLGIKLLIHHLANTYSYEILQGNIYVSGLHAHALSCCKILAVCWKFLEVKLSYSIEVWTDWFMYC